MTDLADWEWHLVPLSSLSSPTADTDDWTLVVDSGGGGRGGSTGPAPSYQSSAVGNSAGNSGSGTCNVPAGTGSGNLLVAIVMTFNVNTPTSPPAGWTQPAGSYSGAGGCYVDVATRYATGSEPGSYTWTGNGFMALCLLNYAGGTGLDGSVASAGVNPAATVGAPSVTASAANELWLACFMDNLGYTWTAPAGFTLRNTVHQGSFQEMIVCEKLVTAAGATGTATATASHSWQLAGASVLVY